MTTLVILHFYSSGLTTFPLWFFSDVFSLLWSGSSVFFTLFQTSPIFSLEEALHRRPNISFWRVIIIPVRLQYWQWAVSEHDIPMKQSLFTSAQIQPVLKKEKKINKIPKFIDLLKSSRLFHSTWPTGLRHFSTHLFPHNGPMKNICLRAAEITLTIEWLLQIVIW